MASVAGVQRGGLPVPSTAERHSESRTTRGRPDRGPSGSQTTRRNTQKTLIDLAHNDNLNAQTRVEIQLWSMHRSQDNWDEPAGFN